MRRGHVLLAAIVLATCGSRTSKLDTGGADALWELAPKGTQFAVVASPTGMAAIERALPAVGELLRGPDFAELAPQLEHVIGMPLTAKDAAGAGLSPDLGAALFELADGRRISILPVADATKWQGGRGGSGDPGCKQVRGVYACTRDPELFDQLGTGSLGGKLAFVGDRGDLELWAADVVPLGANKGELGMVARIGDGTIDLRGRWRGQPDGFAATLADTAAPALDAAGASGFVRLQLGRVLADAPETEIAAGVTLRALARSLRGPIRVTVPAGSVELQIRAPLADPGPATRLIEHCGELPLPTASTQTPGACRLTVQLASALELDAWVENAELRLANHKGQIAPGDVTALTTVGRELATGDWTVAFWGRGTMLNTTGITPASADLPPPAARAIHLMALIEELGAGVAFERGGFRFRVYARTLYANPPQITSELAALDGNAIAGGRATEVARRAAQTLAGSPFAVDFAAGQGGLMIPGAIGGIAAASIIPRVAEWLAPDTPERALPKPMDSPQLARLLVIVYRDEAIPRWKAEHKDATCPALEQLAAYLHGAPDVPMLTDPWGHRLVVHCTDAGPTVTSVGPDGAPNTADDITP
jgi:hypothetical protein